MNIRISSLVFYIIFFISAFCGVIIETSMSSKGIIVLSSVLSIPLVVLLVVFRLRFSKTWAVYFIFLSVILFYASGFYGAVFLVLLNVLAYRILQQLPKSRVIDYINSNLFLIFFLVYISVSFIFAEVADWSAFSGNPKLFSLERLRLFTSEPSYLAMLLVPLFFILENKYSKFLIIIFVILTQSYLGFVLFLLIYFLRRKRIGLLIYVVASLVLISYIASSDIEYFSNSGLIRLVGIKLFLDDSVNLFNIIFGSGLGSGDEALKPFFESFGVSEANSFLFGLVYDTGLLGFLLLLLSYGVNLRGAILLLLIFLNFGAGHVLVPVILFLSNLSVQKVDYGNSFRNY
jgi:hypothetical protein